ncbi:electron carrier/ protein disulfide oxidoreductase [Anaeramoeba flamelloides]|uniref:Electron carrier/ protein disulfide oxidoreductase n=1 Tax=Anaeramoeba flamelloides TaxID=1746091 RepID=A0AAV7ZPR9_9EUKA|nr:electron carrier/ protein disulfide oxidoreductase [Anaeramoeba flamelloides]
MGNKLRLKEIPKQYKRSGLVRHFKKILKTENCIMVVNDFTTIQYVSEKLLDLFRCDSTTILNTPLELHCPINQKHLNNTSISLIYDYSNSDKCYEKEGLDVIWRFDIKKKKKVQVRYETLSSVQSQYYEAYVNFPVTGTTTGTETDNETETEIETDKDKEKEKEKEKKRIFKIWCAVKIFPMVKGKQIFYELWINKIDKPQKLFIQRNEINQINEKCKMLQKEIEEIKKKANNTKMKKDTEKIFQHTKDSASLNNMMKNDLKTINLQINKLKSITEISATDINKYISDLNKTEQKKALMEKKGRFKSRSNTFASKRELIVHNLKKKQNEQKNMIKIIQNFKESLSEKEEELKIAQDKVTNIIKQSKEFQVVQSEKNELLEQIQLLLKNCNKIKENIVNFSKKNFLVNEIVTIKIQLKKLLNNIFFLKFFIKNLKEFMKNPNFQKDHLLNSESLINYLISTYLKPDSIFSINLESEKYEKIMKQIENESKISTIFDEIAKETETLLSKELYENFQKSGYMAELLESDHISNTESKSNKTFEGVIIHKHRLFKTLNIEILSEEKITDTCVFSEYLLEILLDIIRIYYSQKYNKIILEELRNSKIFQKFEIETTKLQSINLDDFAYKDTFHQKAFFINIFNTMSIHSLILNPIPTDENSLEDFLIETKYNIGGKLFSLADIKYGIFKLSYYLNDKNHAKYKFKEHLKMLQLDTGDPRIHFALFTFKTESPILAPIHSKSLSQELSSITKEFLKSYVRTNVIEKQIYLPDVFRHSFLDFGKTYSHVLLWIREFIDFKDPFSIYFFQVIANKSRISPVIRFKSKY